MAFELPEAVVSTLSQEVKDIVMKPEVLAVIEAVNTGLVQNKTALLTEKGELNAFIQGYGGKDKLKAEMEELGRLRSMTEEQKSQAIKAGSDVEAVRTELSGKLTERENELNTLRQSIAKEKVGGLISAAFKDAEDVELILPFVSARVAHVLQADGTVKVSVNTADGTPMFDKNGEHATLDDLANEMKNSDKFSKLFKADASKSGSGAATAKPAGLANNPFDKKSPAFSITKQSELYLQNKSLAITLAAAAGQKLD